MEPTGFETYIPYKEMIFNIGTAEYYSNDEQFHLSNTVVDSKQRMV